jgi:isocitrate dehydrogenase
VQQFQKEGHLRWDSLGEYMALAASLQHLGEQFDNAGARVLADALDRATAMYLREGREPSRKVHEIDNRGSTFYLTLYWAQALAAQSEDSTLAERFRSVADRLAGGADRIVAELDAAQGRPQDLGGYYMPDPARAAAAMRPSAVLNGVIDALMLTTAGELIG